MTEFFGPVLGVMRFRTLAPAIEIVNETGYGLTSGLESLDDREKAIWLSGIRAGNLYINRPTTGAIVYRQPFGGMGTSAVGPGIKAGGPNYVIPLMRWSSKSNDRAEAKDVVTDLATIQNPVLRQFATDLVDRSLIPRRDAEALVTAIASFDQAANEEFLREHDFFRLLGQDNLRRYQPISPLCIRVDQCDSWQEIVLRVAAANAVGARSIVSSARGVHVGLIHRLHEMTEEWGGNIEFLEQTDEELAEMIEWGGTARIRYAEADRVPLCVRRAVVGRFVHVADEPVMSVGRIELLWYVQEQSISADYHRYGNLGSRSSEPRRPTR
jgi:RHH-type proline utilization regulon transcriptional repressor/proline dehydrogenase/delta 1-pyrroline-5-carboxylate dehydrogenase